MIEAETKKGGFVYIMTNPYRPRLIKVGMTTRNPFLRTGEDGLPSTGAPVRSVVRYASWFQDVKLAEEKAHKALKEFHHFKDFFRTGVVTGIDKIENLGLRYSRITSVEQFKPKQAAPSRHKPEPLASFDQFDPQKAVPSPGGMFFQRDLKHRL